MTCEEASQDQSKSCLEGSNEELMGRQKKN